MLMLRNKKGSGDRSFLLFVFELGVEWKLKMENGK